MTTRSCPKCSLLMARCDFKFCPDCGAQLDCSSPSDATTCSPSDYDVGLLNDFGGGDVGWWQDYIRAEIGRANDYWREQYDQITSILKDPVAVHINMLRGTIAWTPEHLRHVLGDSQENAEGQTTPETVSEFDPTASSASSVPTC